MAIATAAIPETDVTSTTKPQTVSGTDAWTVVLALATVIGTLVTACMMPFVALATVTAATMSRSRAAATIGAAWLLHQVIGFALLGYPPTVFALGWGMALLAASLIAMLVADHVLGSRREAMPRLVVAFLAGFAVYELGLSGFAAFVGGSGTFTVPIVMRILLNDACWFVVLLAAHMVLSRLAPRAFGPVLRLGAA